MSKTTNSRGWVCALVAVSFLALGISGLLMLLHLRIGLDIKALHVVMGLVFIAVGIVHLTLNWKTFTAHLRNRSTIIAAAAAALVAALLLFVGDPDGAGPHRYGQGHTELGIGTGEDLGNGSGPFGPGPRGYGRGGPFGHGRWDDSNRKGAAKLD